MRRIGIWSILAMALSAALPAASPSKAKVHGYPLSGTVMSVDQSAKTFVVKSSAGKTTTLVWTPATTMAGGELKVGEKVTLRYLDRGGKHIATSVLVGELSARKTPPATPTAFPAPTPKS
jgi:hypothetical protein